MSVAEQVGLIAELLVLQKVFLKRFNPSTAINIWCGIEDKSQDFSCSEYRLEVKSIIDHNKNSVIISSEDQLDGGELPLYLTIVRLERSSPDFPESVSLYSLIKAIESQLTTDANALDSFREKMLCKFQSIEYETDLLFKHYNQLFFSLSDISYYSVEDGFPRIIKENLPNGIHNISYTVNLDECSDFKVDEDQIFAQ